MNKIINLETLCAYFADKIVNCYNCSIEDKENLINKALGVLVENGFYAMNIFLLSAKSVEYGKKVFDEIQNLLIHEDIHLIKNKKSSLEGLENIREITKNLPDLILARKVVEQTLTFARYHCKAMAKKEKA